MNAIKRLLVMVDPTAGAPQTAVDKAKALAIICRAEVELAVCESSPGRPSDRARDLLKTLSAPLLAVGLRIETTVIGGDGCHSTLLKHVVSCKPDWVIKGTHPHRLSSRLFFRSTDWHLINECPVPLLLCKRSAWAVPPVILAAIDPTSGDLESARLGPRILDVAYELSKLLQGSLHVAHVYKPAVMVRAVGSPTKSGLAPAVLPTESESEERERHYAHVLELVRRCEVHAQQLHVDMGSASSYLPFIASEQRADIVVVGASGSGVFTPMLHEGIAARILDSLRSDLLVLRR